MIRKILATAVREYRTTALTRAFFFGAVILPLVIWGAMLVVGGIDFKEPALEGTLAVIDRSEGGHIGAALEKSFDIEEQKKRDEAKKAQIESLIRAGAANLGLKPEQIEPQMEKAMKMAGIGQLADLKVEVLAPDTDAESLRPRVVSGDFKGLLVVDEGTIALNPSAWQNVNADGTPREPGTYEFIQPTELRPSHADKIKGAVQAAVREERFHRVSIDPLKVDSLNALQIRSDSTIVTAKGEKKANEGLAKVLPILFFILVYMGSMYGGSYLFYGTLEEKSSRVVEVLLSAVSVKELLLGKFIGQGLVGLSVLAVYATLGIAAASRFPGVLDQIPLDMLPWLLVYFLIAYGMFGALMLAVGSAVSEVREAQALFAPVTMLLVAVYVSIFPVMQNPGSIVSHILSFFPPTMPFVMVMRMSQPSHTIPTWELFATLGAGILGVVIAFSIAAKVFRIGILMYGKPPTLMTIWKWLRYA